MLWDVVFSEDLFVYAFNKVTLASRGFLLFCVMFHLNHSLLCFLPVSLASIESFPCCPSPGNQHAAGLWRRQAEFRWTICWIKRGVWDCCHLPVALVCTEWCLSSDRALGCWMHQLIIPFISERDKSFSRGPFALTRGYRRTLAQMRPPTFKIVQSGEKNPTLAPVAWWKHCAVP